VARILLNDSRVATIVWPLEQFIRAAKFALIPAVVICLGVAEVGLPDVSSHPSIGEVANKLIGPIVAIAYVGLLQTEEFNRRIDKTIARLYRRISLACNHDYAGRHGAGDLACRLTPDVFQAPVFDYRQQLDVVSTLAGACDREGSGQYWFVQGNSGTGKTRAGLRLIQRLVRDPKLFELGRRCYLYDLSDSPAIQRKLLRHIRSARHDDAVVLIDNFQLVKPDLLHALTYGLVEEQQLSNQRVMVFLAREAGAWNVSPQRDVRLLSEAKVNRRYCKLEGPSSIDVVDEVAEIDAEVSQLIEHLENPGLASASQLHLAQVIVRNRSVPPEAMDVIRLLAKKADSVKPENARMLALLTAVAMHRGTFSRRSLWRAIRTATRSATGSRPCDALHMGLAFRRFHRVGLVTKLRAGGTRYVFHEDIARQCIDTLSDDSRFAVTFQAVGAARLKRLMKSADNALRAWLVAAEIGDQSVLEEQFEVALLQGAYQRMARCLDRAKDRYRLDAPTRLQLAILLDRVGDFAASRKLFVDGLDGKRNRAGDLTTLFATSRLEANHQHDYERDLELLLTSPDPLVSIVGEYWKIHIGAHRGTFEPDGLKRLVNAAYAHLNGEETYWQLHSIIRMYFDSLRHLYLTGEHDASAFVRQGEHDLKKYLQRMPTYDALRILYTKAHLVGHVLIPRLGIFGKRIESSDAAFAGLVPNEVGSIDRLIVAAQRLYQQTRDEFWLYGDREEKYLQAEILNTKMIEANANLAALDQPLDDYEQFIVNGEQSMLASYPHLYRFRRDMLIYFQVLLDLQPDDHNHIQHYLDRAERHLQCASKLDAEVGNTYGQMRAELLEFLVRPLRHSEFDGADLTLDETELGAIMNRMSGHRYGFEQRLLRHLRNRTPFTVLELREIFRFYPFVNQ
jgi:hypothetical protein